MSRRGFATVLVCALAALLLVTPRPEPAQAIPTPCDLPVIGGGCDAVGEAVTGAADGAAGAAGEAALGGLTGWVGDGAAWLLGEVATAIDATTGVDLGAGWFAEHYDFMFAAGAILLLPLLLLAILQSLLRQDPGLLARAAFLHLPGAMLLTGLAVAVTQTALAVTDALAAELSAGIADDTGSLAQGLAKVSLVGGEVPVFAAFVLSLVMALAALFVWFELVLRAAAIYVAVMFLPLFLAAMIWPATSGWIRRLVQLVVAAVLSKLVIVATLSLGLSAFASGDSASAVLAGAGMFMLAAFSPFVLYSLLPLVADAAQPQRESRRAIASATGASLAWSVARTRMAFGAGRAVAPGLDGARRIVGNGGGGPAAAPGPPGPGARGGGGGRLGASAPTAGAPRARAGRAAPSGAAPESLRTAARTPYATPERSAEASGDASASPRRRPRTPPPTGPAAPPGGPRGA